MTDYHDSTKIPDARVTRINCALAKFFVACSISFWIVEHPFFVNFVKELNSAYELPTREFLSDQLLERELALVNSTVATVIENGANLTLGFFRWLDFSYSSFDLELRYHDSHKGEVSIQTC
ncbi:hypothetical protein RirG_161960 [Rhizophagus irregularis DAOM 197198w]|uniref:Uncharacterized protein n=1 Tax=Rhizophagus irregularis (strain DAOM 197198w) TaxID=1432141 RepID=A0A015K4M9_RHIIW|nr:hypothetical protein RirG_161960 [Rhizophagus irregularis DAOM 197198w]